MLASNFRKFIALGQRDWRKEAQNRKKNNIPFQEQQES